MRLLVQGRTPAGAAAASQVDASVKGVPLPEHALLAVDGAVDVRGLVRELGVVPSREFDAIRLVCRGDHLLKRKCYSFFVGSRDDSVESQLLAGIQPPQDFERTVRTESTGSDIHVRVTKADPQELPALHFHKEGVLTLIPTEDYTTACFVSSGPIRFEPLKPIADKYGCDMATGFTLILPLPGPNFYDGAFLTGRAAGMVSPFYGLDLALQLKSGLECGRADTIGDYKNAMRPFEEGLALQKQIWQRVPRFRPFWLDLALRFAGHLDLRQCEKLSGLLVQ